MNKTDPSGTYTCTAGKSQCGQVKAALQKVAKAAQSYKEGSPEQKRLQAAVDSFGAEGEKNGVVVQNASLRGDALAAVSGEGGQVNVGIDFRKIADNSLKTGSLISQPHQLPGVVAHEGIHVWQRVRDTSRDRRPTLRRQMEKEIPAYRAEFHYYRAAGALPRDFTKDDEESAVGRGSIGSARWTCDGIGGCYDDD